MSILKNYQQDLIKSLSSPLLIELNKKDIKQFGTNGLDNAILNAQSIYNRSISIKESTNLIYINGNKYNIDNIKDDNPVILLEEIIKLTSKQIQSQKNINIVKAGVKGALSYFTGSLVKESISEYVDAGIDQVSDMLSDTAEDVLEFISEELDYNFTDEILGKITNNINETLDNASTNILEESINKKLNLSINAKNKLDELSSQFNSDLTPIGIFSLILQLILAMAIKSDDKKEICNKIIFINNPHKLDKDSLAVLSLLFSFAKDLKEKAKHTGISVVYCYSDDEFQPYQDLKNDTYKVSKKLLDEQRRFTQRYAMLERPSSDIPNIVVKSSTFVGREKELQILKEQFNKSKQDSNLKNLEVINADPGIGKTKLVNKHIKQVRESQQDGQRIIQLTLLNQVGHSSSNTGLSSLKDSVLKEAKRLATVKALEDTVIDKIKDMAIGKVITSIEGLLGVNNIIEIGSSVKDAFDLEKNTIHLLEQSSEDINNKNKNSKEQQFEDIREAILQLQKLCDETLPIILFIDDIQWIDDESSEFILKYFTQTMKFNPYIVATQRVSDATTALKLVKENVSLNPYKISLLQQAGIETDKFVKDPENVTKLNTNIIDLKGLDKINLTELISLTIDSENKNDDKIQKDKILALSIINNLINEESKDKKYGNTLFAIETINMLCDEKLYSSNANITEQLILQNPLRYNESIEEFSKILEDTFKVLNEKYTDAFEHANSDKEFNQQFNLMAYAVLEERLHILHEYFGEYGNAAVNTLLFSSLLGTPFNSKIVQNVLEELSTTKEPLLQPLKKYINESQQCNLNEVHYEIIEEVYEILSRYILIDSAYSYKHNLLEVFLDRQLEYILDSKFEKENIIEAKDKLFELIIDEVNQEEKRQDFYNKHKDSLNSKEFNEFIFYVNMSKRVIKKGFTNNRNLWIDDYISLLNKLSILLNKIEKNEESIIILNEALEITRKEYSRNPDKWTEDYAKYLNNLAFIFKSIGKKDEAVLLNKKALDVTRKEYSRNHHKQAKAFINSLINLGNSYYKFLDILERSSLYREALEIIRELYKKNPEKWAKDYIMALGRLANSLNTKSRKDETTLLRKEALEIIRELYKKNPEKWARDYIMTLRSLYIVENTEVTKQELTLLKSEVLDVTKELYKKNPEKWAKDYIMTLRSLALASDNIDSISYLRDAVDVSKKVYNINPSFWLSLYIGSLEALAIRTSNIGQNSETIKLYNEILKITEVHLDQDIERWGDKYLKQLHNFETILNKFKETNEVNKLKIKIINISKKFYSINPERWRTTYMYNLLNTVMFLQKIGKTENIIFLIEDLLEVTKELYTLDPIKWCTKYINALNLLGKYLNKIDKNNQVVFLYTTALEIAKDLYYKKTDTWYNIYIICLKNMISIKKNNETQEKFKLYKELLIVIKKQFNNEPEKWYQEYIKSLKKLALLNYKNQYYEEAIELFLKQLELEHIYYDYKQYIHRYNELGNAYIKIKNFDQAIINFKEYFELFNSELIINEEYLKYFINPIVKYYQLLILTNQNTSEIKKYIKSIIQEFQSKFGDKYQDQLNLEYNKYLKNFQISNDVLNKERSEIFKEIFFDKNSLVLTIDEKSE